MARYNRWLNKRPYDACEKLIDADHKRDRGAFFGLIHQTLIHLMLADARWLQRFARQGVTFPALEPGLPHLPAGANYTSALHADWADFKHNGESFDAAIEAWLAEMAPIFLLGLMRYTNRRGVARQHPAWQALNHFFNHHTHHHGQVTALLMQAGVDVGVTDLIALASSRSE